MVYTVNISDISENFLKKLDKSDQLRIRDKLRALNDNPRLGKPLVANLAGFWSLRVGKYRIIYEIKEKELVVYVIRIGHRKNVYS